MPGTGTAETLGYVGWPLMLVVWGLIILAVVLALRWLDGAIRDRRWLRDARMGILERRHGPRASARRRRARGGVKRIST